MTNPYPTEFPTEAFSNILTAFRGESTSKTMVASAYVCAGYALSQFVGPPEQMGAAAEAEEVVLPEEGDKMSQDELEAIIETQIKQSAPQDGAPHGVRQALPPFVWNLIFAAIQKALERLLKPATTHKSHSGHHHGKK
jgi:hypothetical protein